MDGTMLLKTLQMSLTASYAFCVVFLARLFLRKIGRKYCYYLWFLVFLNLCFPFSIYSSFSLVPGAVREQAARIENDPVEAEQQETEASEQWVLLQNTQMREYDQSIFEDVDTALDTAGEAGNGMQRKDAEEGLQVSWKRYLPLAEKLWILGILSLGVYSAAVSLKFQYRLKKSENLFLDRQEGVAEVKGLTSPFVWGLFSAKIYLPAGMEAEERNYVLLHEKYHRKRKDHLLKLLLYGITVIYWYQPLVWISYYLCCKDMEMSCDEAVLERADTNIRKAYARSILQFAAKQNRYLLTPLTFGEPAVRSRIENVLRYRKKGFGLSILAAVLCIFLGIGLMTQPKKTALEEDAQTTPADFLKLKVSNNGGEILKAGSRIYYENGWRDSLVEEKYLKISINSGKCQEWDPKGLQELAEEVDRLNEPIPGKPLEDVSAWDLERTIDLRESFQQMSYASEMWIEDQTYLLGKTAHYTLYGKGDQETLLLESEGAYTQIQYPYTSNYMTPLDLLETDLDGDGQAELGIKFNIKHGTGVSIDTLFLADREANGELYVYQFLEEDCSEQFMEHLSYEATEKGVQARVDGKAAGAFLENEEGMDPYVKVTCGAQLHFTYENGQIIAGADLQFLQDEIGAFYGSNGQEICGVVNWDPQDGFVLSQITGRAAQNVW